MNFSALTFSDHVLRAIYPYNIKGGTKARYTFENGWTISVVSGPKDSGLYGIIGEDTFEVAVYRSNGNMLDDCRRSEQRSSLVWCGELIGS